MDPIEAIDLAAMPRIQRLRSSYFDSQTRICPMRTRLATESWKATEGLPVDIRRAMLFAKICDELPIAIFDDDLIAGSQTTYPRGVGLQLDYSSRVGIEKEEGDRRLRADQTAGALGEDDLRTIVEDTAYWKGRAPGDVLLEQVRETIGPIYEDLLSDVCIRAHGILTFYMPDADYDKVLRVGLKGILAEIEAELAALELTSPEAGRKFQFLRAAQIACEAEIRLARRYAALARDMAARERRAARQAELERIAAVCERVPQYPARTFWEALQSVRLVHLGLYLEDGDGAGAVLGRLDQYLYPNYRSDLAQGTLTRERAAELLASFWVRIASVESLPPGLARLSGAGAVGCRVTLGGVDREGKDAANELTYLILHVAAQMKMAVPLYLRWHSGTSRDLMLKAASTNIQIGSEPAFHNDEQAIRGLVEDGATLQDARDYVVRGCSHPFPYGSAYGEFCYMNGGKVLELVMNRGRDLRTGKQLGIDTGDPCLFASIQDWIDAFLAQWERMYDTILQGYNLGELVRMQLYRQPFASALLADCIQKGTDVHGGGARYLQFASDIFNKVYADVPDALVAIKTRVYDEHCLTIAEILDACAHNFEGERGEAIRQLLRTAPKYGNDLGEPEALYRKLNDRTGEIGRSRTGYLGYPKRDVKNGAAVHYSHGRVVGALPNGRMAGLPLADGGISPCAGCDTRGPTVTLRSVAKAVDFTRNRSAVLNQKIPASLLKTPVERERFVDLVETYFRDYGGYQIQWNIQDRAVYLAAKANPSEYKNLIVRVGGYSAYFVELDSALQDEIIARTEQRL